jgi:hypothetical protein
MIKRLEILGQKHTSPIIPSDAIYTVFILAALADARAGTVMRSRYVEDQLEEG